ncbi:MAG TPA: protein kinase [Gemmatimonadaceae bacterium]|nr:protein kinase [Gemmatimonadaceae bacterium]
MTLHEQLQSVLGATYTVERELGGGGMSRVFVATETALGRSVVIKVVAPGLLEGISADRFTREVRLAARLQQANIVPLLSAGEANGLPYYTMPFVDGLSLRARLASGPPLSLPEAVHVLRDVAKALAYAHAQGVVHRDIKPENVLLSGGTAMVTDFGIAKALSASRTQGDSDEPLGITSTELTAAGSSLGTPAYMSPEQAVGSRVDFRADLYAWGIMAYELLAHAHPFAGRATMQQLIAAQIAESPTPLAKKNPAVPPALSALVMQCLEKDPASRPASANELLAALDAAATPDSSGAARSATPHASGKRRITLIGAGIALLAIIGLVIAMSRHRAPRGSPGAESSRVADRSIAVLPLTNLSGDKADDYFGIGLAEEMTRAISKTGVRVIGRVSASALLAKGLDEQAIAKELGVGSLLTGSVQHAGNQVRINVSLLSAADGAVRWTERYDRPLTNVFAVQDEIARAVAENLLGSIGERASAGAARIETADPQAYSLFLQGQVLFGRRTAQTVQQSISLFEQAVARDPKYARAQAGLALALAVLPSYVQGNVEADAARTTAAARRAIALDSTIAESYTALAYTDLLLGDNRDADEQFRKSLALDSTVATTWGWYGLLANGLGNFSEAHRRIRRGRELEPASLIARTWDTQVYIVERNYRAADSLASETIRIDSTFALIWLAKAEARLFEGQGDEAVAILERRVAELPPHQPSDTHSILAYAYARAGMTAKARALLESQRVDNGGRLPATGMLAATLEELGDHEAAIALLAEAVRAHDAWLLQYARAERYDKLRRDPRGAALLGTVGTM